MQATPSTWTMLFNNGWRNRERVKILCGGEPLPTALKHYFQETGSEAWNLYGPTETTIWSTVARVQATGPVAIGKPIANTQIYIVDEHLQLAAKGKPGELCISGDGLALGYWNRPGLTAEKFIDNPFKPGTRLYRTGDLARWLLDGEIEHLGRLDFQVKIRGFRIELGEIESLLNRHVEIAEAVVVAKEQQGQNQLLAYYQPKSKDRAALGQHQLRDYLASQLPEYMVPALFIRLDSLPMTANGKINRQQLMGRAVTVDRLEPPSLPDSNLEKAVLEIWQSVLDMDNISTTDGFFEVGGNSILAVTLAKQVSTIFKVDFTAPSLFKYATVRGIARYVEQAQKTRAASTLLAKECTKAAVPPSSVEPAYPDYYQDSLAIIGISCQLPGAQNYHEFWQNLCEGKECRSQLSEEQLRQHHITEGMLANPNFIPVQYSMDGKETFDAAFFNISPKNAVFMDPQCRMLLQHAWAAIEDAGYRPGQIPDTAVFMSAGNGFYRTLLHNSAATVDAADTYGAWVANQSGTIPTLISYHLGLKGPSLAVHSNCSSSLAGLYLAYQSLQANESKYALVGAANILPIAGAGHLYQPDMNFSSDGHCKAFDASADGLVGGEGVAVIMVKKALDAIADGDHIYALLRGIGINNDGNDKAGFYAPDVSGQADVIAQVLKKTDIHPETIAYVEAHGTGTKLGDPIEVMALNEAYRHYTVKKQFCGIGSVKPNIGHLDTAAGLAGCIKVVLSLYHGEIPPSINYRQPNPAIDFQESPFYVLDQLTPWSKANCPRRAAVSAFGIGGTNTHAIFEGCPFGLHQQAEHDKEESQREFLIALSAKNEGRLKAYAYKLSRFLCETKAPVRLEDVAFTLQVGRQAMAHRVVFIVRQLDELVGGITKICCAKCDDTKLLPRHC